MHSKPQKRTAERLICRESWKSCLPAKTKARARMQPLFLQPSCALRSRFEAHELIGENLQAKILKVFRKSRPAGQCRGVSASPESQQCRLIATASRLRCQ